MYYAVEANGLWWADVSICVAKCCDGSILLGAHGMFIGVHLVTVFACTTWNLFRLNVVVGWNAFLLHFTFLYFTFALFSCWNWCFVSNCVDCYSEVAILFQWTTTLALERKHLLSGWSVSFSLTVDLFCRLFILSSCFFPHVCAVAWVCLLLIVFCRLNPFQTIVQTKTTNWRWISTAAVPLSTVQSSVIVHPKAFGIDPCCTYH